MEEKRIHQIFEISVLLKGAHALFEVVSGVILFFISTDTILRIVSAFTEDELVADPHDFIANYLSHAAAHVSLGGKMFGAYYLLSHGIVKLFLVAGLLRNKLWAYPASLVVLGLFIAYQVYRYTFTHSIGLIVLTVFDVVVMYLIWHEYNLVRKHLPLE